MRGPAKLLQAAPVDPTAALRLDVADDDILSDGEIRKKIELLKYNTDYLVLRIER